MDNLRHIPAEMNYQQLRETLKEILEGVSCEDTLEGFIEFTLKDEYVWFVTARYRVGNKMGQGGIKIIGSLEPE